MAKRRIKANDEATKKIISAIPAEPEEIKIKSKIKSKELQNLGPLPSFRNQRFWARFIVILAVICIVYFTSSRNKEKKFAPQKESIPYRHQKFQCSPDLFKGTSKSSKCVPSDCGRYVTDTLISSDETDTMLRLAKSVFKFGGLTTGISVFDLHSGDLAKGGVLINLFRGTNSMNIFTNADVDTIKLIRAKVQHAIAEHFLIDEKSIHLANPALFFRMNNVTEKNAKDEYWHAHIDKELFDTFHYTAHLFLNDCNKDFQGGRFIFMDGQEHNKTHLICESRKNRVLFYTSGGENTHFIEQVTFGFRYVLTIGFTCHKDKAGINPTLKLTL